MNALAKANQKMSEQPSTFRQEMQTREEGQRAESAGEWTPKVEGDRLYFGTGYWDIGEVNARTLEATINAALAAEQEKVEEQMEFRQGQEDRHKRELAAEREKIKRLTDAINKPHPSVYELRALL
jgi:hypothetical protein